MDAWITNKSILQSPTAMRPVKLIPSSVAGRFTVAQPNGRVISIQPDGSEEDRPAGTDGPFEQAKVDGSRLLYVFAGMENPVEYRLVTL